MQSKILLLVSLVTYSIIVSQSFMYIIALKNVQNSLPAAGYIELRKLIDVNFVANFKYPMYAGLVCCLLLVLSSIKSPGSILFITSAIAFAALVIDTLLAIKGNIPINTLINSWTPENYPADWQFYRAKWLEIFQYRQVANISGFISLLVGAVFNARI